MCIDDNKMSDLREFIVRISDPEKLILAVKKHPAVWNTRCPEYKVKKAKEQSWHKIASEVIGDWKEYNRSDRHITLRRLIKRWNNIRDYHVKSLKVRRRKKYAFADQLAFLQPELQRKMNIQLQMNQSDKFNTETYKVEEEKKSLIEADMEEAEEELIQEDYITFVDTCDHDYGAEHTAKQKTVQYEEVADKKEDPDMMFLKSVLSDMKKLADDEKFAFKYAVIQAYMDILKKRKS